MKNIHAKLSQRYNQTVIEMFLLHEEHSNENYAKELNPDGTPE